MAGASRAVPGVCGSGSVSFTFLALGAISYAPDHATREDLVRAIGRGIGRTAVHEFAHQLFPTAPLHDSHASSDENESAHRWEHHYGELRRDLASPLLQRRLR